MKIKLFAWWNSNSAVITERFKQQFIGDYFNSPDFTLTCDDDYDYAVIFGYTQEKIKTDKQHTIVFFQEPFWSNNWNREAYKISNYVFCPSKKLYGNYDEFIESKTYMFYGGHGDEYFNLNYILNYKKTDKLKNLSTVVTYRTSSPTTGCNTHSIYDKRVLLSEECVKRDVDIDVYGQMWEYCPTKNDKIKGGIYTKYLALDDYRFSIGIENSCIDNYITEKLYDVLFFNTIPVYYGAPNIKTFSELEDIPIILDNINNIDETINIISGLNEELYHEKIKNINIIKYNILSSDGYNLWKKIQSIIIQQH